MKILQDTHPDVHIIQPESAAGHIKIDQIRSLQHTVFQTPQLGTRGIVVIHPADALNLAAASALLKTLEEPPATMIFILVTTQPSLLLPTLRSRCQSYRVADVIANWDPLALGQTYPEGSVRVTLYQQRLQLLDDFDAYVQDGITPCTLAERWSDYPLYDIVWFLYALTA
jgi:DNA polymerase-3 subunit delta'